MPSSELIDLIQRIDSAYRQWTGGGLPGPQAATADQHFFWLHQQAPYSLLAHGGGVDPVYANHCAQQCFGYSFDEFIALPSRLSASPVARCKTIKVDAYSFDRLRGFYHHSQSLSDIVTMEYMAYE